jgi:hypothetical protein
MYVREIDASSMAGRLIKVRAARASLGYVSCIHGHGGRERCVNLAALMMNKGESYNGPRNPNCGSDFCSILEMVLYCDDVQLLMMICSSIPGALG